MLHAPSIIGPTAPAGTDSPWDHQSATIVVRKIAGKTVASPESTGTPALASAMPAATAPPASPARAKSTHAAT